MASAQFVAQVIRRLAEVAGLGLWVAAAVTGLALASFTLGDPSPNLATGGATHNLIGATGAAFADLVCRTLGWACLYAPLLAVAWGWRLVVDHRLPRWRLRLLAAPLAWLLLAMALGGTALSGPFDLYEGAGGAVGAVALEHLIESLGLFGFAPGLTFSITAGLATLLGLWALALDIAELSLLGHLLRKAAGFAFRYTRIGVAGGLSRLPRPALPRMPSLFARQGVAQAPSQVLHAGTPWAGPTASAARLVPPANAHEPPLFPEEQESLAPAAAPTVDIDVRTRPGTVPGSRHYRWATSRHCHRWTCCKKRGQSLAMPLMPTC